MSTVIQTPIVRIPIARQFTRVVNESVKYCSLQGMGAYSVLKGPTDIIWTAPLTLRNVVAGSRYRVTRTDTGAELATGVASGSGLVDVVISGVPCYADPQSVSITVRNASGSTKYKVFNTAANITKSGGEAYILQIED